MDSQLDSWLSSQYLMFKHEGQKGEPRYPYNGWGSDAPGRNYMKIAIFRDDS